jgi:hypothetical protein
MNPYTAYDDFECFWKRLCRHCKAHKLDYINVIEPQSSGRWHFHVMIKSDQPELWIDKWRIKEIWGQGNAYIERLKSNDVGAYYVSYFTHLYAEERGESVEEAMNAIDLEALRHDPDAPDGERMKLLSKAKIKGARLKYYPVNLKFYRCTRSIIRPLKAQEYYHEAKLNNLGTMVYSSAKSVVDGDGTILNTIQHEFYNNQPRKKKSRGGVLNAKANPNP